MPISHEKKYIHIHIPKTAGTSITIWLDTPKKAENYHSSKENILIFQYNNVSYAAHHAPAILFKKLCGPLFDSYYKFSFVRNPYDRTVSKFFWSKKTNEDLKNGNESAAISLFQEYLEELSLIVNNDSVRKRDHDCLQSSFVYGENNELLVNDLFKLEEIDSAIKIISSKIEVTHELRVVNKRRVCGNMDKNVLLTGENKEKIYSIFKKDFENFGYDK